LKKGIYRIFEKQIERKILIISSEVLSKEMAGPAIRVFNFAKVLSEYMDVKLAVPNRSPQQDRDYRTGV